MESTQLEYIPWTRYLSITIALFINVRDHWIIKIFNSENLVYGIYV